MRTKEVRMVRTVALGCLLAAMPHVLAAQTITPIIHPGVQIEAAGKVIQIDPWSLGDPTRAKPAYLILITDDPIHHLDPNAIAKVRKPGTTVLLPPASLS